MAKLGKVGGIREVSEDQEQTYSPRPNGQQQAALSMLTGQGNTTGTLSPVGDIIEIEEPAPQSKPSMPTLSAPAPYQSNYQSQIDSLLNSVLNRESFSYDMNADPLYQQYKDQYIAGGRAAMMDTMGQAAALTGGYGNSYANTAGNIAYQNYLTGLNDRALDLYSAAYGRYVDEGDRMMNNLGALMSADDVAYGRYMDSYNQYLAERDFQYQQYLDALAQQNWEAQFEYQQQQDQQAQENWQMEYDYTTRKWKKKNKNKNSSGGSKKNNSSSSSSGSSGSNSGVTAPTFDWNQWVGLR